MHLYKGMKKQDAHRLLIIIGTHKNLMEILALSYYSLLEMICWFLQHAFSWRKCLTNWKNNPLIPFKTNVNLL